MIASGIALAWAASVAAFFMHARGIQRRHEHRVDRLVSLIEDTHLANAGRADAMTGRFIAALSVAQEAANQPHADLAALIAQNDRLCQRLQAPTQAVVEHAITQPLPPLPAAVEMDDDDAHWESREQMAERLMEAERMMQAASG